MKEFCYGYICPCWGTIAALKINFLLIVLRNSVSCKTVVYLSCTCFLYIKIIRSWYYNYMIILAGYFRLCGYHHGSINIVYYIPTFITASLLISPHSGSIENARILLKWSMTATFQILTFSFVETAWNGLKIQLE